MPCCAYTFWAIFLPRDTHRHGHRHGQVNYVYALACAHSLFWRHSDRTKNTDLMGRGCGWKPSHLMCYGGTLPSQPSAWPSRLACSTLMTILSRHWALVIRSPVGLPFPPSASEAESLCFAITVHRAAAILSCMWFTQSSFWTGTKSYSLACLVQEMSDYDSLKG